MLLQGEVEMDERAVGNEKETKEKGNDKREFLGNISHRCSDRERQFAFQSLNMKKSAWLHGSNVTHHPAVQMPPCPARA